MNLSAKQVTQDKKKIMQILIHKQKKIFHSQPELWWKTITIFTVW